MTDLENGPSPNDMYDSDEMGESECPEHGLQKVVGVGSTGGPDPYGVETLWCGHRVVCFGPGEPNEILR